MALCVNRFFEISLHACGVRVQRVQKVLRVQRVADCRSAAMLIKSALRDLLSVSYGMISILVIRRYAAPPYPAAPDFLHGKACHTILRSLCSLTNRVPLPPLFRGQNKTPRGLSS